VGQLLVDGLVTLLSIAVVAHYVWSARAHFASSSMPRGSMLISAAVLVTLVLFLLLQWLLEQPLLAGLGGVALELASLALFWAAILASGDGRLPLAFDAEGPRTLVTGGPYRYLRHPFYLSYIVFWSGWALATWSVWSLPSLIVLVAIYVAAARGEERLFAASPMAAQYAEYCRRAGFLWPRLTA
jgi:protein-S-isoprenylcysteine O-methyltransferase Ste14